MTTNLPRLAACKRAENRRAASGGPGPQRPGRKAGNPPRERSRCGRRGSPTIAGANRGRGCRERESARGGGFDQPEHAAVGTDRGGAGSRQLPPATGGGRVRVRRPLALLDLGGDVLGRAK